MIESQLGSYLSSSGRGRRHDAAVRAGLEPLRRRARQSSCWWPKQVKVAQGVCDAPDGLLEGASGQDDEKWGDVLL